MLKKLTIFFIFMMIFGEAFGITIIGTSYRLLFLFLSFSTLLLYILFNKMKYTKCDILPFYLSAFSLIFTLLSFPFWSGTHNIYSYVGIPVAFIVYFIDFKFANKLVKYILLLTLILGCVEFFTKKYLFINEINGIEFNEKMMGGTSGVFRAKVIFYGPTVLGMFVSAAYLLNYKKFSFLIIAIITSFFANARLGVILLAVPLLSILLKENYRRYLMITIIIFIVIIAYSLTNSSESIERLLDVNKEGSQDARIFYWISGIMQFINYPITNILFGNNGLFTSIYENNPESGWICLLTDNGIVGFLFYLLPLVYCLFKFFIRKEYFLSLIVLIFIAFNFAITYHLSGTGNLMYWLIMFELLNKAKFGYSKLELSTISSNALK